MRTQRHGCSDVARSHEQAGQSRGSRFRAVLKVAAPGGGCAGHDKAMIRTFLDVVGVGAKFINNVMHRLAIGARRERQRHAMLQHGFGQR